MKELKRDTEDNIDRYEDTITHLDGVYSAKPAKKEDEMKELVENFGLIAERTDTVRRKVNEAKIAIEKERNKEEVKKKKRTKMEKAKKEEE